MTYRNLAAAHRHQAERLGPRSALRFKRYGLYHDMSWAEYRAEALACASALVEAGVGVGDRVGLLAENRIEWLIADMGILAAGAVNVPPHCPLTAKQVAYQLADAGARWLFVSTREQLAKIRQVAAELPDLKGVVAFEASAANGEPGTLTTGARVTAWPTFLQSGRAALQRTRKELERREVAITLDSLATIMYTSGTTGNPKGVMLTHGNLLSNAIAIQSISPHGPDDILLNWLPLSHIYARTVDHYRGIVEGVTMALAESAETVVQNLAEIRPTHLAAVPRFYEKVLSTVATSDAQDTGKRLRAVFGPRMDWLMSGGAPLPLHIAQAYCDAGLLLLQGYGLTETAPVITYNRKDRHKIASVGLPLPGVEVKIGPDGEVLTRGPHVMPGYWNNPQATAESIRDGWFHTGDLGSLDADGFLSITGRKKELLVLSNGKKVVPNYIEGLIQGDECIDQAVVGGEGRNFLTALIVPHWDNVRTHLQARGTPAIEESEEQLAGDPRVRALLAERINAALAEVSNSEQVRKFLVLTKPFSVAADELTVSLKLRRNVVLGKYVKELETLYRE